MKFRTELSLDPVTNPLNPRGKVVLLGSCFSANIGGKMTAAHWDATINPTGVLFNPSSIAITLTAAMLHPAQREALLRHSLTDRDSAVVSWLSDASTAGFSPEETLDKLRSAFDSLHQALLTADTLILTWGTAYMYALAEAEGEMVVTNCHKHTSSEFKRRRASSEEIAEVTASVISALRLRCPDLRVIVTVSPVRHIADGATLNSRSKAILLLAAEDLCSRLDNVEYFPAFELLNDDLRDYRFYASDLCHPSAEAVEYVWEKFCDRYLDADGRQYVKEGEELTRRLNHRSQMPGSREDILFREQTERLLAQRKQNNIRK